ncbi:MAG: hypothetical protein NC548_43755 [Lachnospiraceae bacterium]|nr:hypothetical protein [Corallococcus sp.]MCM1221417.1 hypothetical protein [Lachnospiraceae bacterium]
MTKEQQIVQMAVYMSKYSSNICDLTCKGECKEKHQSTCIHYRQAKRLADAGYGNVKTLLQELYDIVKDADCQITVDANDVIKLAERWKVKLGEQNK